MGIELTVLAGRRPRQQRRGRDRESPAEDLTYVAKVPSQCEERLSNGEHSDLNGTKIRVENVHYDLTKEDLEVWLSSHQLPTWNLN